VRAQQRATVLVAVVATSLAVASIYDASNESPRPEQAASPSVVAAAVEPGFLSGRLTILGSSRAVPGARVTLYAQDAPEQAVGSVLARRDGSFTVTTPRGDSVVYLVKVTGPTILDGWVGAPTGGDPGLQPMRSLADAYPVGAIGSIDAVDDWISGVVVDDSTADPIAGVVVTARDVEDTGQIRARAVTDALGQFRLERVGDVEVALRLDAPQVKYVDGYLGCDGTVARDWVPTCPTATGNVDWISMARKQ